ncbi:MAG: hypothetical protein K8L91_19965 [Anaerolineae bacterium]|nr:hypothetical protein [Anaerolineae bacterium]
MVARSWPSKIRIIAIALLMAFAVIPAPLQVVDAMPPLQIAATQPVLLLTLNIALPPEGMCCMHQGQWGTELAWSSDGRWILVGHRHLISVWDTRTASLKYTLWHPESNSLTSIYTVAWNHDNTRLLVAHINGVTLWDMTTGRRIFSHYGEDATNAAWNHDETQILLMWGTYPTLPTAQVLDAETGAFLNIQPDSYLPLVENLNYYSPVLLGSEWSPMGRRYLEWFEVGVYGYGFRVVDADAATILYEHTANPDGVSITGIRWDGMGRYVLSWGWGAGITFWDAETGETAFTLLVEQDNYRPPLFTADDSRMLTKAGDLFQVWIMPQPEVCWLYSQQDIHLRGGPGPTYPIVSIFPARQVVAAGDQVIGEDGHAWWQARDDDPQYSNLWMRGDVIETAGDCADF